jgi:hypothetical protein
MELTSSDILCGKVGKWKVLKILKMAYPEDKKDEGIYKVSSLWKKMKLVLIWL